MHGLRRRWRELVHRTAVDREAVAELEQHVEFAVAEQVRSGLSEEEARRRVRMELGRVDSVRDRLAEGRTGFRLEQLMREFRYGARVLRRAPGSTILSVLTIGLGIALSTLLFTLVDGVILRPLPYPASDRLVRLFDTNPPLGVERTGAASGNIDDWRRETTSFEGIAGYYLMGRTLSVDADADMLLTAQVSEDFFPLSGVAPVLGRLFTPEETLAAQYSSAAAPTGTDPVVILGHDVWQQRFGGDAGVIGRSVMLERRPFRVVGVMPPGFALPEAGVELWIPWDLSGDQPRDQHYLGAVGRVASGVSLAQAEEDLNRVAAVLGQRYPDTNAGWGVRVSPLADEVIGDSGRVLWLLFGAVGLVLLVACANVALLSVMRGLGRATEWALRLALGSTPGRLIRQCWIEAAWLAALGGALGVALALGGLALLPRVVPDLPRLDEVAFSTRALWFTAAATALAALVSGVLPAWRGGHQAPAVGLRAATRTATGRQHALRDALVVAQVALAVVLLCGSGLLVRSVAALGSADTGFEPAGVVVAPIFLDAQAYPTGEASRAYYASLLDRIRAMPGVTAAGGATTLPTSPLGPDFDRPVWPDGGRQADAIPAAVRMITPGYLAAMGMRVAEGRPFDDRDHPDATGVVMVSETLAARLWPGRPATGQRVAIDYSTRGTGAYEVVGVVGDVRFRGPRSEPRAEIYIPHAQNSYLIMHVAVRAAGDPRGVIPAVRAALREVDPQKPAYGLRLLTDLVDATTVRDRQAMVTLLTFAGATVFLAMLGVYGVLSARVRERRREIGVRMALGAGRADLLRWVAARGTLLMACGAGIGLAVAWLLSGLVAGLLFEVTPTDPVTLAWALVLLCGVGCVAVALPSWRATTVDPVTVLRSDL